MILHGNPRGGSSQLAAHLLRMDENEHVEVHEVRGFVSSDLKEALHEAYAVSRATRCRQFLYSVSLNPPQNEDVPIPVFESAIAETEQRLGLTGQPRVVVFHEKEGRRHAHCVWSRIRVDTMKAINLPFTKRKLRGLSQELFAEHGWQMPAGLIDYEARNPMNFTHDEWQQARRTGNDIRETKEMFRQLYAASDSRQAFSAALEERGYLLAQGDRRGFVAVDYRGEVHSVARYTGIRTQEINAMLGDSGKLQSVNEARRDIGERMLPVLKTHFEEIRNDYTRRMAVVEKSRQAMVERHRNERARLKTIQQERALAEQAERSARFRRGMRGLWDRLTGHHAQTRRENEQQFNAANARDKDQQQTLRESQLGARRTLQTRILELREERRSELLMVREDAAHYRHMRDGDAPERERKQAQGMSFEH